MAGYELISGQTVDLGSLSRRDRKFLEQALSRFHQGVRPGIF